MATGVSGAVVQALASVAARARKLRRLTRKWQRRTRKALKLRKRQRRFRRRIEILHTGGRKRAARIRKRARHLRLTASGMRIRASYHAHRRLLANRSSRNAFLRARPKLTPLQTRLVEELKRDGIAATNFHDLVADRDLWRELCGDIGTFAGSVAAGLSADRAVPRSKSDYLIRRHNTAENRARGDVWSAFPATDPWVRLGVRPEILDVVNAYRDLWTKYLEFDQWYTVPFGSAHAPIGAQNWHRDDGDRGLVTVFVYFSDIDDDAGPLQYVTGSHESGSLARMWPWRPFGQKFITADEVGRRIQEGAWRTMTGPAGLMVFADSSGLHRGGSARMSPRIMSYHVYASPAAPRSSLRTRNFAIDRLPPGISDAARFALT